MIEKEEELLITEQKKIIQNVVSELSTTDPSLYYVDSSSISQIIHEHIHEGKLQHNDFEKVKDLRPGDILILLSYKTNCC